MKKSMYTVGVCIALALSSCSGSIEDAVAGAEEMAEQAKAEPTVVGFWELSEVDLGIEIPADQKAMFDAMKKDMIENSNVSYKEDGTYAQNDYMDDQMVSSQGTYVVNGDKLLTTKDGIESTVEIKNLTATEMTLSAEQNGTTISMSYKRP